MKLMLKKYFCVYIFQIIQSNKKKEKIFPELISANSFRIAFNCALSDVDMRNASYGIYDA